MYMTLTPEWISLLHIWTSGLFIQWTAWHFLLGMSILVYPQQNQSSLFLPYSHNVLHLPIKLNNTVHSDVHTKNQRIIFRHSILSSCIHYVPMISQLYLQKTSGIQPPLSTFADTTAVLAIIVSHLECCNSLLCVSSLTHLPRLNTQFILYMEAKVILFKCKSDYATAFFQPSLCPDL